MRVVVPARAARHRCRARSSGSSPRGARFVVPLVLITDPTQQPGSIAIFGFIGNAYVRYGDIAAFSLIYAVPIFLLYALSSRLFRGGFVLSGAVKG